MLPFLEPKKISSVIMSRRGKTDVEATPEVEAPGSEMDGDLKEAATDLLRAIDTKSIIGIAQALRAAFEVCGMAPEAEEEMGE